MMCVFSVCMPLYTQNSMCNYAGTQIKTQSFSLFFACVKTLRPSVVQKTLSNNMACCCMNGICQMDYVNDLPMIQLLLKKNKTTCNVMYFLSV